MNTTSASSASDESPLLDARLLRQLGRLSARTRLRTVGAQPGDRRSARRGAGQEFVDFRPYAQGDEPRQVDWNLYARSDRLMVKQFGEERDLCVHLLIDTSASMGFGEPSKLAFAARAAAALGYVALASRERVALGLLGAGSLQRVPPRRGRRYQLALARRLQTLNASGTTSLASHLRQYASASTPGVAVVFSDLLGEPGEYTGGLGSLLARGFDVQVVHILSRDEIAPPYEGDLRVMDVEGLIAANDVSFDALSRNAYDTRLGRFREDVRRYCRSLGVPWLGVTDTRLDGQALVAELLRSGFVAGR